MRTTTRLAAMRAAAAAGALAVGLAGLGLGATASADPTEYGNIRHDQDVSLTIHKHVKQPAPGNKAGRPTGDDPLPQAPVEGVVFTAYRLSPNLTTPDGWKDLEEFSKANPSLAQEVCNTKTLPGGKVTVAEPNGTALPATDGDGKAVSPNGALTQGAYLVCETDTSNAKVAGKNVKVVDKALPFVVTLPFPDTQGAKATKGWIYDVHAYPKDTVVSAPNKTVSVSEDSYGMGTAKQITYTIDAVIPDIDDNTENFKYFNIWDQLAKGSSDIQATVGFADGSQFDQSKATVHVDQDTRYVDVNFNTVEGLKYLRDNPGKTVRVTVTAKLDQLPADGKLDNQGHLTVKTETVPHDPGNPPKTPSDPTPPDPNTPPVKPPAGDNPPTPTDPGSDTPTNKVVSSWGNLVVRKFDANDSMAEDSKKAGLNGAEFKIVKAKKNDGSFPADCADTTADDNAISVNGESTFTSKTVEDKKGIVSVPGLFVDSKHTAGTDVAEPEHNTRCYYLVETKAPVGYVLDSTPKPFVVKAGTTGPVDFGTNLIGNSKHSVPSLPLTGASGQVLMMVGGAALVLLAGGTVMVARRRDSED